MAKSNSFSVTECPVGLSHEYYSSLCSGILCMLQSNILYAFCKQTDYPGSRQRAINVTLFPIWPTTTFDTLFLWNSPLLSFYRGLRLALDGIVIVLLF